MPRKTRTTQKVVSISPRMQAFVDGTISLDELDDEEIMRGQLRDKNGGFSGRPSDYIPRKFHTQLVRETIKRMEGKFRESQDVAYQALIEIASNPRAHADARYKASVYLIERIHGKVPDRVIAQVAVAPWEDNIEELVVDI